jgi:glycosyltransferase involved in cell wall biosynthesis
MYRGVLAHARNLGCVIEFAMPTSFQPTYTSAAIGIPTNAAAPPSTIEATLLTAGRDRHYVSSLAMALVSNGISLDVIGSDEVDGPELHTTHRVNFINLRGSQRQNTSFAKKAWGLLIYYARLIRYARSAKPKIFHILWNGKFEYFDRTMLMLYYKLLGKKIALTAHNVNAGKRDLNDSWFNRLTLTIQYRLVDHIFVHTDKMKGELLDDFGVREQSVTVIPHGINNSVPDTDLTPAQAKQSLGVADGEKAILFLGKIRPYKGLEYLLTAFQLLVSREKNYRLIIAGEPTKESENYFEEICRMINREFSPGQIILKMQFIPDAEMELFLKAADVLVLPYKEIFQSGVLFLGYSFGLPVIATDVGSFREDIIEGKTGFLCKPADPVDLAKTLGIYFQSDLYKELPRWRLEIRDYGYTQHSWDIVGRLTHTAYTGL